MAAASPPFSEREIDASINACLWCLCLPLTFGLLPYKTTLYLTEEEVTKTDVDLCGRHVAKHPYGELGSVERSTCCCFVSLDSAFGPISPGCGCDRSGVDDMCTILKERMRVRGDTGQIKRTEETLQRLEEVDAKLTLIMEHLKIPIPETMNDRDAVKPEVY